jgi:hypothetical protein
VQQDRQEQQEILVQGLPDPQEKKVILEIRVQAQPVLLEQLDQLGQREIKERLEIQVQAQPDLLDPRDFKDLLVWMVPKDLPASKVPQDQ